MVMQQSCNNFFKCLWAVRGIGSRQGEVLQREPGGSCVRPVLEMLGFAEYGDRAAGLCDLLAGGAAGKINNNRQLLADRA